jgi:excisionase family DNA binding protein
MTTPLPPFMTILEASEALRMHHTTLRKAVKEGRLQASRPDGRALRFTPEQLQQWLASTSTSNT